MSATLIRHDKRGGGESCGSDWCGYTVQADGEEAALLDAVRPVNPNRPPVYNLGDGIYAVKYKYAKMIGAVA